MLLRFYKSRYFIVIAFLLFATGFYYILYSLSGYLYSILTDNPFRFGLSLKLAAIYITIFLTTLVGISAYGIERFRAVNNKEYLSGFYFTATLSILASAVFAAIVIYYF
jgi:hypothetical protein